MTADKIEREIEREHRRLCADARAAYEAEIGPARTAFKAVQQQARNREQARLREINDWRNASIHMAKGRRPSFSSALRETTGSGAAGNAGLCPKLREAGRNHHV